MQVQAVNNYNNNRSANSNISFDGTIHKSVTQYMKDLRDGIILTEKSATFLKSENQSKIDRLERTKELLQNIKKRLKDFMDKTAEDTELFFKSNTDTEEIYPIFRKGKTELRAYKPAGWVRPQNSTITVHGIDVYLPHMYKKEKCLFGLIKPPYKIEDLEKLDFYTKSLVEAVRPEEVDKALNTRVAYDNAERVKASREKANGELNLKEGKKSIKQAIDSLKSIEV